MCRRSESHEPAAQTNLSHITATDSTWNPNTEEDAAASFTHASYKPRTNILTSDTKGIFSHAYSFTLATIINLSLLCCLTEVSLFIGAVVLGWMISPSVEPGTFRFQSKVLAGFLLHHFPLCVPPPLSPLSLSLSLSPFVPLPPFFLSLCFCFSPRKTDRKKKKQKKNESVFIHATLPIIHSLSL